MIHSKNAELIHILEENNVSQAAFENKIENELDDSKNEYLRCFIESIKFHHNNIAEYFENNFMFQD